MHRTCTGAAKKWKGFVGPFFLWHRLAFCRRTWVYGKTASDDQSVYPPRTGPAMSSVGPFFLPCASDFGVNFCGNASVTSGWPDDKSDAHRAVFLRSGTCAKLPAAWELAFQCA